MTQNTSNNSLLGYNLSAELPHVPDIEGLSPEQKFQEIFGWAKRMRATYQELMDKINSAANIGFRQASAGGSSINSVTDGVLTFTDSGGATVTISGGGILIDSEDDLGSLTGTVDFLSQVGGGEKPENNATLGSDWSVDLSNVPARFADAIPASGSGLLMTADAMGYYKSGKSIIEQWTSGTFVVGEEVEQATSGAKGLVFEVNDYSADAITNGDMELDSDWADVGTPATNERSGVEKHGGSYSRKFTGDVNEGIRQLTITLAVEQYRLTMWVYPDDSTDIHVHIHDGNGTNVYDATVSGLNQDAWNEVEIDITGLVAGSTGRVEFVSTGAARTWYIDDVTLIQHDEIKVVTTTGTLGASNVITGASSGATVTPSTAGDITNATAFGMYISSSGDFYFAGDDSNYIAWDGTNINIVCSGGYIGSSTNFFDITNGKLQSKHSSISRYVTIYDGDFVMGNNADLSDPIFEITSSATVYDLSFFGFDNYDASGDDGRFYIATNSSTKQFLWTVACDGQLRLKMDKDSALYELYFWELNYCFVSGATNAVQGALRVNGNDLECYLNSAWQKAAMDTGLSETVTFGGGASGEVATLTFTDGLVTGKTLVP